MTDSPQLPPSEPPGYGSEDYIAEPTPPTPYRQPRRIPRLVYVPLLILILILLAFVGWKVVWPKLHKSSKPASQSTSVATQQAPSEIPDTTETKPFHNVIPSLDFNYPVTWTVTQKDNAVRIESPTFSYSSTDKGNVSGYFRIYIRQGARSSDSKYIGRGVAIQPTDKLTYDKPAAGQRKDTNLSYFGYDTPDNFAYFMITSNFSLKKGDTLGPTYAHESDAFVIAGGYSEPNLTDDLSFHQISTSSFQKTKAYTQAINIIKSLQIE